MKRKKYTTCLSRTLIAVAFLGTMSSCVLEKPSDDCLLMENGDGLSVVASVSESSVRKIKTKAEGTTPSDPDLKEKDLVTLDVFVEHVTGGTGDGTIMLQYHLTSTPDAIQEKMNNLLADDWRAQGLKTGEYYNVYVATNNTRTAETKDLTTFNVAQLKALVADEVTDGVAVVDESTNNITWGETTTSGNIYKLYSANPGSYRALTSDKKFMMDGVIKNWTPDPATQDQVFDVTLNRAAAKIVINVKFDADFLKSLTHTENADGSWTEKPEVEQVSVTDSPAWKFYNFAFGAQVFDPKAFDQTAAFTPVEVHNSDFNIFHNQAFTGDDKHFSLVTYTYPNTWNAANYATAAPSLVISVPYKEHYMEGDVLKDVTNYHYYRIPIVPSSVNTVERNHIYVINATIATRGSTPTDDQEVIQDVVYEVLPWNDETNTQAIHSEVQSVQHYYFNVNPKVYTLRGDGDQSVVLNYSKAAGTKVNWKLFTYDANGNQTGVVANNATNAVRAWFYDADGDFTTSYNDNSGTNWSNTGSTPMGVSIVQSTEGTSGSKGTVTITSTALNNKAIKYIRLRVYLDEESTFDDSGKETMYEDIIIRHFPTDNIQSIEGSWSSYYDKDSGSSTTTYTTESLEEAQSLARQYGITYTVNEKTENEPIDYATYSLHQGESGYSMVGPQTLTRQQFRNALQRNDNRRSANGQANAILADGWYYWGENPSSSNENNADYYVRSWGWFGWDYDYYSYAYRYTAQYYHTYSYNEYILELPIPSTGDWVDWDAEDKSNHSSGRTYYAIYDPEYDRWGNLDDYHGYFKAKVMDGSQIYSIVERQRGGYYSSYFSTERGDAEDLTNNHMYVIQISSTSDSYVLGRPYVDSDTHQSQDNVVSPAFMIASQLGAVTIFNGENGAANAAEHCSRYMEVTADGTRYIGWRLPTENEIKVITGYQFGTIGGVEIPSAYQVLTPVLTGYRYWALNGQSYLANTGYDHGSEEQAYLRCVRDLSAAEVERLNGFDKIQEKYQ